MPKEMLINAVREQECRIAIVQDGKLDELYVERASNASHVGNIYKGRITNVESAIQAAFVDFGPSKNGFLHISDVHPQYFPQGRGTSEAVGRKRSHRDRPPIQECLKRGQEVVVQMTKEGIGTKGPTMTTYLSIPGRLLVMMPGMSRLGVSRKIENEEDRQRAKDILNELNVPDDMGFIVRTAGVDRTKRDMQRDLNYLLRLWKAVTKHIKQAKNPSEIYQESDLVTRTIRDIYNNDIQRVICDDALVAKTVLEFLKVAVPRGKYRVELYTGNEGLFQDFGLESEIEKIYSRRVELASGGSLVIDQTEALVAIDVNSGRFRQHTNAETTATKLNIEAAQEIARQLRLRDLGGVIVLDFVDMREEKNRRAVERTLRDAIKPDRAKTKILRISQLGLVEMTRQRTGESLVSNVWRRCACCDGVGSTKSEESQGLLTMRQLQRACAMEDVATIEASVKPSVAHYLNNQQRDRIVALEVKTGKKIVISPDASPTGDDLTLSCTNQRGSKVSWDPNRAAKQSHAKVQTVPIDEVPAEGLPVEPAKSETADKQEESSAAPPKAKKRRRGGARKKHSAIQEATQEAPEPDEKEDAPASEPQQVQAPSEKIEADNGHDDTAPKKPRRRGKRGGRKHRRSGAKKETDSAEGGDDSAKNDTTDKTPEAKQKAEGGDNSAQAEKAPETKQDSETTAPKSAEAAAPEADEDAKEDAPAKPKRRRRRRKPAAKSGSDETAPAAESGSDKTAPAEDAGE